MLLLTNSAQIYLNGSSVRETYELYKTSSAQNHKTSDDATLKQALIRAMSAPLGAGKTDQGGNVFRVKVNDGKGYLVYKLGAVPGVAKSAAIFHYHWNYTLDLPLTAT